MCKGFLDKDRSPGDLVHKAFCLSALALHVFHVFHLVVRFCSLKIEAFSTSERGLQYFHTRFPLLPSHILLIPCLSLSLPSSWGAGGSVIPGYQMQNASARAVPQVELVID